MKLSHALALAAALALPAPSASAGTTDLRSLGRELAQAARTAGLKRVAVSRIEPARGADNGDGVELTESLIMALVRSGRIQAVERTHLDKLMREHALGRSGAMEGELLPRLGRLAHVGGVVTGTYIVSGRRLRVLARVVELETGLIVGAAEAEVDREDLSDPNNEDAFFHPHDGAALSSPLECSDAEGRVNLLEGRILEIKARYWALRLRRGLPGTEVTVNPGSTIPDPELKRRFYERLKHWHGATRVEPLTPEEVNLFVRLDAQAYSLHRDCHL